MRRLNALTGLKDVTLAGFRELVDGFKRSYADDWTAWVAALHRRQAAPPKEFGRILRRWQACGRKKMRLTRDEAPDRSPPYLEDLLRQAERPLANIANVSMRQVASFIGKTEQALKELWNIFEQLPYGDRCGVVGISKAVLLLSEGRVGPAFDSKVRKALGTGGLVCAGEWIKALKLVARDIEHFELEHGYTVHEAAPPAFRDLPAGRLYDMAFGPRSDPRLTDLSQRLSQAEKQGDRETAEVLVVVLLFHAVEADYRELVARLLAKGVDANAMFKGGMNALRRAARSGNTDIAKLLIEGGAEVNAASENGWTSLHTAAQSGHHDVVKLLTDTGANVNAVDQDGRTPTHTAIAHGHVAVADLLIRSGADVNVGDVNGQTALHTAVCNRDHDTVELLVAGGADVKAYDSNGQTALHMAAQMDNVDLAGMLISAGAAVDVRDFDGYTPLAFAEEDGRARAVKFLLEKGANPNTLSADGETPLVRESENEKVREAFGLREKRWWQFWK